MISTFAKIIIQPRFSEHSTEGFRNQSYKAQQKWITDSPFTYVLYVSTEIKYSDLIQIIW